MLDLTTIGVLASIFIAIVYLIYRDIRVIMQTVVDLREEFMMLQLGKQSLAQDDETGCYGEEHDEEDEDEEGGEDEKRRKMRKMTRTKPTEPMTLKALRVLTLTKAASAATIRRTMLTRSLATGSQKRRLRRLHANA